MRITRKDATRARALLRIEGKVVGEWAALLDRECSGLLQSCDAVHLDLVGVVFVDQTGVEVLRRLGRAGVEILCRSGAVAGVLEGEGVVVTRVPEEK